MAKRHNGFRRIAALNDALRKDPKNPAHGRVLFTAGVHGKGPDFCERVLAAIAAMTAKDFKTGNDPYGERDFNTCVVDGKRVVFKIDYYAKGTDATGSEDPADPAKTERVMTIMFPEDY